eukprot:TRINITY_DN4352_c0_g1_i1.p2 TRINITY_DN4352_c0_g1~~TRINITY_DN4352_c0_g1_i1.p2  ORF type:complete len:112 (-),score=5.06 TRINITY_DN4352_c0_g1_i1:1247-1582(-)
MSGALQVHCVQCTASVSMEPARSTKTCARCDLSTTSRRTTHKPYFKRYFVSARSSHAAQCNLKRLGSTSVCAHPNPDVNIRLTSGVYSRSYIMLEASTNKSFGSCGYGGTV